MSSTEPIAAETTLARARRLQAEREIGVTAISRRWAAAATALLLATLGFVPLWDGATAEHPAAWLVELGAGGARAGSAVRRLRPVAANRELQAAIDRSEESLEADSQLRSRLLPAAQWVLTGLLGAGSEQAYPGVDGWLFYRPDVDYVIGRGFLEPAVLAARARGGEAWLPPPRPDPLPALEDLRSDLSGAGIELLVMPVPVKPTVHPQRFRPAAAATRPVQNASFRDFLRQLAERSVPLFDPAPLLTAAAADGEPQYLRADTHWTPEAMDRVAAELARRAGELLGEPERRLAWTRRPAAVSGAGDIVEMLRLPPAAGLFPAQRVTVQVVVAPTGQAWRSDPQAEVLLLGDSFTNVFSDPALGWGQGAGLAEQLAFHLGRPVDRIALSAGGAHGSREALARQPERLAGKRLVIYQFAARELAFGDWKAIELRRRAGAGSG